MRHTTSLLPFALLLIAAPALAQGNPRGEAKAAVNGKNVVIEYGRPSLKGRDMLAEAKPGTPWRLGSDAPTTLQTDADLTFGAVLVPQGRYVLNATKVADDKWVLNVLKAGPADGGQEKTKIGDVPLTFSNVDTSVEMLTIELKGSKGSKDEGDLVVRWGHASLSATFSAK
jgi:DUF2911 family protein